MNIAYQINMKKIILTLLSTFILNICFSQTYKIDSFKIVSNEKIIVEKYLEFYIDYKVDVVEFKRNGEVIHIFKHTSPKILENKAKFICYDGTFELLFFEINERYIIESYKGLVKIYHINKIYEK